MKILIINTFDIEGGAARAAYRLHKGLRQIGIESRMLVQLKKSEDATVAGAETKTQRFNTIIRPLLDALPVKRYKNSSGTLFSAAWVPLSGIVERINSSDADIVHLHWIAGGMLRIEDLAKIKKPIVWSLHDMWAFTGGCHYDEDCGLYTSECHSCPVLKTKYRHDLSNSVFRRKLKVYGKISNMTIIGLSNWLAECAGASILLGVKRVVNRPNPVDTTVFKPVDKRAAKKMLNLPLNKKLILFGAMSATSDPRKGFAELSSALRSIKPGDVELAIFGSVKPPDGPDFRFKTHYLGKLHDDLSLRIVYSAADVMVVPSIQENLSNAVMESLSCGTPVVAFNIGGNPDMIDHKKNGYLAKPYDSADLARGISWVLEDKERWKLLSKNARIKVVREFAIEKVARRYVELYREILGVR